MGTCAQYPGGGWHQESCLCARRQPQQTQQQKQQQWQLRLQSSAPFKHPRGGAARRDCGNKEKGSRSHFLRRAADRSLAAAAGSRDEGWLCWEDPRGVGRGKGFIVMAEF
ncbi:unnamed protein product [Lampetra planeri]